MGGGSLQPRIASPSVPAEKMSQGWSQTRGWVRAAFSRHQLLFVNCGVSVGLSGLGDLLQQWIEAGRQRGLSSTAIYRPLPAVNWSGTANMSTSFGLTAGLLCHHWYKLLDNFLPGRTHGTRFFSVLSASQPAYLCLGQYLRQNLRVKSLKTRGSWGLSCGSPSGSSGLPPSSSTSTSCQPSTGLSTTILSAFSTTGTPPI